MKLLRARNFLALNCHNDSSKFPFLGYSGVFALIVSHVVGKLDIYTTANYQRGC